MRTSVLTVIAGVVLLNLGVWAVFNRPALEQPWSGVLNGVSFSPFGADQDPLDGDEPTAEGIERDLATLDGKVHEVRTYGAQGALALVPALAEKHGMAVTAGAWIDARLANNEAEVEALIALAQREPNVKRALVGNESLLRDDVTIDQLAEYLRRVRDVTDIPVSTAEPWHVWLANPELADAVDFIAVHVLPYWEGVPAEAAVDHILRRYEELRVAFPGKHIVLTEIGWPSGGTRNDLAEASVVNQARVIRRFLNVAEEMSLDYYVMEAFDQPWKGGSEGSVGAHWGIFDEDREAKFPMAGPIHEVPNWVTLFLLATALAFVPLVWFNVRWAHLRIAGKLFFGVLLQTAASMVVWSVFTVDAYAVTLTGEILGGLMIAAQLVLLAGLLVDGFEMTEMVWTPKWRRQFLPARGDGERRWPMVSIQLAIANEPPDMVKETLAGLARLDYPRYEVIVVDNNTKNPAVWQPVEAYCRELGPRFRFYHFDVMKGFKAGALNFALSVTDPDVEVVGVIDSDYVVEKDWLRSLVPYFDKEKVAFVQAPQDNRAWEDDRFKEMINWEYAGFFHLGMVQRNERDALIMHGTMTLMRRSAMEALGRWGEWCICEDAELALRFYRAGYESVYVNHVFGRGLTPDSFSGYKKQRFRWAYGAVQILKRHWRALLPGSKELTTGQRYHFATGWLPWFTDGLQLLFTLAGILWTIGLVAWPRYFEFPLAIFLLPTPGIFAFKLVRSLWMYEARVPCTWGQRLGAAAAGMGLTYTVGKAMLYGIFTKRLPFLRTPKCEDRPAFVGGILMAWEELLVFALLWAAAIGVLGAYGTNNPDALIWALVLGVQSLPYLAALLVSMVNAVPALRTRKARAASPALLPGA